MSRSETPNEHETHPEPPAELHTPTADTLIAPDSVAVDSLETITLPIPETAGTATPQHYRDADLSALRSENIRNEFPTILVGPARYGTKPVHLPRNTLVREAGKATPMCHHHRREGDYHVKPFDVLPGGYYPDFITDGHCSDENNGGYAAKFCETCIGTYVYLSEQLAAHHEHR